MSLTKVDCYGLAKRKDMIKVKNDFIWTKDMVKTMHMKVTTSKMSLMKIGSNGLARRKDMIKVKKDFIWTKDMVKTMYIKVTISKNVLNKSWLLLSGLEKGHDQSQGKLHLD